MWAFYQKYLRSLEVKILNYKWRSSSLIREIRIREVKQVFLLRSRFDKRHKKTDAWEGGKNHTNNREIIHERRT